MINVIYHKNCFDGMASAYVCSLKFGTDPKKVKYIPAGYDDEKLQHNLMQDCYENANINDEYVIVDFSFSHELMKLLADKAPIIVLDHHKTAQANCEGLDFCKFDMNESGATMVWKHFFPNQPIPNLIRYIKDRDLWLFQERASQEVNAFIQSFPMTIIDYARLHGTLDNDLEGVIKSGESIERYKNTMIQTGAKFAWFGKIAGYEVPIANATMLFSEIGNELCKQLSNYPFSAYFTIKPNGKVQWGLRSIGEFDVSEIAKKYNGGGHKNAAGFVRDDYNFRDF